MKPAISINTGALGDTIAAIPTINKLSKIYEQPITVFTTYPELFVNHPSVLEAFGREESREGYEVHHTFNPLLNPKLQEYFVNRVTFKHSAIDIRQFHAIALGITLLLIIIPLPIFFNLHQFLNELIATCINFVASLHI